MNLATVISLSALILCVLHAVATWIVASAPGMRGLRVFSVSCVLGGLYASTNIALSSSSYAFSRYGVRWSLLFAGLHSVSWYVYTARRDGRALYRWERWVTACGTLFALASPVTNLFYVTNEDWVHGVPSLGIRYHDAPSTPLGNAVFAYIALSMIVQLVRAVRRLPTASAADRAEAAGLAILIICGINDSLVASAVWQAPYLLDVGFLALVVFAAAGLALRFVDNARALAGAQQELIGRERLAALGEMSAVVAHEVRNPVAIIFNAAASLRKMPEEKNTLIAIIEEEAERLKRMTNDLLDFARPTSTHMLDVRLDGIIESVIAALREAHAEDPEVEVEGELPGVHADVRMLRQAILNLVTNALQSPDRKTPVKIRAAVEGERVRIDVIDDGSGVSDAIRSKMFRPFFTTRPTGTGLGLAIVRRIVEAHGGRVVYSDTPGGGATFTIDVARERDAGASPKPRAAGAIAAAV